MPDFTLDNLDEFMNLVLREDIKDIDLDRFGQLSSAMDGPWAQIPEEFLVDRYERVNEFLTNLARDVLAREGRPKTAWFYSLFKYASLLPGCYAAVDLIAPEDLPMPNRIIATMLGSFVIGMVICGFKAYNFLAKKAPDSLLCVQHMLFLNTIRAKIQAQMPEVRHVALAQPVRELLQRLQEEYSSRQSAAPSA